jgi:lysophospholipase L1-like esterase
MNIESNGKSRIKGNVFCTTLQMEWKKAVKALCLVVISLRLWIPTVLADDTTSPTNSAPPAEQAQPSPHANESPDVPAIRLDKEGQPMKAFLAAHDSFLKRGKSGQIGLLFIGDSITAAWPYWGKAVWKKYYGAYNAADFGFGGDRTQNVLWRIDNGELDGISPAVVVLLIGTNNHSATDVGLVPAIKKIVDEIHGKLPNTKVLLLGIFPRGNDPQNPPDNARIRAAIINVNKALAAFDDGKKTRFLDIGSKFLDPSGAISKNIMADGLHPTAAGYQIWADAMQPLLDEMLKDGNPQ